MVIMVLLILVLVAVSRLSPRVEPEVVEGPRKIPEGCELPDYATYLVPYDCMGATERAFWNSRRAKAKAEPKIEILE